jgi:outer membrane receptor protein involved in Fe transport
MKVGPRGAAWITAGFLLAVASGPADGALLRGRILDPGGTGVTGAAVHVEDESGAGRVRPAGADGVFALEVERAGTLVARCYGYEEWRGLFQLSDTAGVYVVTLHPRVHRLPGVEVQGLRRTRRTDESAVPIERLAGASLRALRSAIPVLADRLRRTPEVGTVGRDDYNAAPAVRGLARFRTVLVLDGARLNSDREIGATAGFVDPVTLEAVEVIRGPGSVLYGSDAIGGVVHMTSAPGAGTTGPAWIENGYSSVNRGVRSAAGGSWSLGALRFGATGAYARAGDYALPGADRPWDSNARSARNSGFERHTLRARSEWNGFEATSFYSFGEDIGRPGREQERFTIAYEKHSIHSLSWRRPGGTPLELRGTLHPTSWQAVVEEARGSGTRVQKRDYSSLDWSVNAMVSPRVGSTSVALGAQADARSGVRIVRRREDRDSSGALTDAGVDRWVGGASTGQAGLFAHTVLSGVRNRWILGARLDRTWRRGPGPSAGRLVPTGQVGLVRDVLGGRTLSLGVATAYREPTVTELYFSGKRPAGTIEGNPLLRAERSFQVDAGVASAWGPLGVKLSVFGMLLRDWITLVPSVAGSDTLTFGNASRASLYGGSIEVQPRASWRGLGGRVFLDWIRGSDRSGVPLGDLHAPRARAEITATRGAATAHVGWRGALPHRRVGAGEIANAGYSLLETGANVRWGGATLGVAIENLMDREVYERNDPVSYPSPGRSFHLSLRFEP